MTRDSEFLDRWGNEQTVYAAFGAFLVGEIIGRVRTKIPVSPEAFFKIPPSWRTKDSDSLLEKAFYRGKNYKNPFEDITDKVGARFVPLLGCEIAIIESALQEIPGLDISLDRDYELEQIENPVAFDYAAKHYVVRPSADLEADGIRIPAGIPCEVQIKNVLQHAYSEMSHDTIYKPQVERTPEMLRDAAKAMALLEATNDYFEKVAKQVAEKISQVRAMTALLSELYRELIQVAPEPSRLEGILLDRYEDLAPEDFATEIREMFKTKSFLADIIRQRISERNPIFRQPSVLLVYLDIYRRRGRSKYDWPLTPNEMEPLLNDLGEAGDN